MHKLFIEKRIQTVHLAHIPTTPLPNAIFNLELK